MLSSSNTSNFVDNTSNTLNQLCIPSNRVIKKSKNPFIRPLLARIKNESEREYQELQQVFQLLGWQQVSDLLKVEICTCNG